MPSIDPATIVAYPELERGFWRGLRAVIARVFEADEEIVEGYQLLLASASPSERLMAMHDNPLEVAAALSGVSITETHIERYRQLLRELSDATADRPETAFTSTPITLEQLEGVLHRIGYRRVRVDESRPFLHWILEDDESLRLPRLLTYGTPQFATDRTPELVYDRADVLDFLISVYGDAIRLGAPENEAVLILRARQELQLAA